MREGTGLWRAGPVILIRQAPWRKPENEQGKNALLLLIGGLHGSLAKNFNSSETRFQTWIQGIHACLSALV
ncbi:MAG: hypothetical protein L0Z53_13650 [Acidobacteriales bacterium]|nr:hypothetical protein [Terriglobales bacterium]